MERYELAIDRIGRIGEEETVGEKFRGFFREVSAFILKIHRIREMIGNGSFQKLSEDEKKRENESLYEDILPKHYEESYANPAYAVRMLGEDYGRLLSFLYTEIRGEIVYAFEKKDVYLTVCN